MTHPGQLPRSSGFAPTGAARALLCAALLAIIPGTACMAGPKPDALATLRSIPVTVVRFAYPGKLAPDASGLYGENAKAGQWLAPFPQRGALVSMEGAIILHDGATIDRMWPALATSFSQMDDSGSFNYAELVEGKPVGPQSRPTDNAFLLGEAAEALLLLSHSEYAAKYAPQVQQLLPAIARGVGFIEQDESLLDMQRSDQNATNRLVIDAKALILCGLLVHDAKAVRAGDQMLASALHDETADGVFPEHGGWDFAYQAVSILRLSEICLFRCSAQATAGLRRGLAWESSRIGPDGAANLTGDTRTNGQEQYFSRVKTPNWTEVARALAVSGAVLGDTAASGQASLLIAQYGHGG